MIILIDKKLRGFKMNKKALQLTEVQAPALDCSLVPVQITDDTMDERKRKVLALMQQQNIDSLVIYADLEHGSNFEYLVGFLPRFEEALLILHKHGEAFLVLGNENIKKAKFSRIEVTAIHAPQFSLPNQPMVGEKSIAEIYQEAKLEVGSTIGVVGWKLFTSQYQDTRKRFDVPHYLIDDLFTISTHITNRTDIFISADYGVRTINNANEIAHYEFGSSLASDSILKAMDTLDIGCSEIELGAALNNAGQKNTVVTIAATGERFYKGNLYPTDKKVKLQDTIALTVGYKGGLSSRAGYAVYETSQLPMQQQDYLEVVVKPYFNAIIVWLENIHCGMLGGELYTLINEVLPKEKYHWSLCPGHLTSDEEWMSSPIYENSKESIKSGMLFQTDIIPAVPGYGSTSVESTVILADQALQESIKQEYPLLWERMMKRKEYLRNELHIFLHDDVLPMASTLAYLRPYLLNKNCAMKKIVSKKEMD
jgi:Xaa-Pro aminopeptidase